MRTLLSTSQPAGRFNVGYLPHDSLIPRSPCHQPMPTTPPPAGDPRADLCGCPACLSGRYYDVSPTCRFLRADCEICRGTRTHNRRQPRRLLRTSLDCLLCAAGWDQDLTWFYFAYGDTSNHTGTNHAVTERPRLGSR